MAETSSVVCHDLVTVVLTLAAAIRWGGYSDVLWPISAPSPSTAVPTPTASPRLGVVALVVARGVIAAPTGACRG